MDGGAGSAGPSSFSNAARGVSGVATAKAALQPQAVRALVERTRPKDPFRRRHAAYVRPEQGARAMRHVAFID